VSFEEILSNILYNSAAGSNRSLLPDSIHFLWLSFLNQKHKKNATKINIIPRYNRIPIATSFYHKKNNYETNLNQFSEARLYLNIFIAY